MLFSKTYYLFFTIFFLVFTLANLASGNMGIALLDFVLFLGNGMFYFHKDDDE